MLPELGQFALVLAFVIALTRGILPLAGAAQLRCLQCQNQAITESDAPLAADHARAAKLLESGAVKEPG